MCIQLMYLMLRIIVFITKEYNSYLMSVLQYSLTSLRLCYISGSIMYILLCLEVHVTVRLCCKSVMFRARFFTDTNAELGAISRGLLPVHPGWSGEDGEL